MKNRVKELKFAKMKLVQIAYGQESEQINQQQALALVPNPQPLARWSRREASAR